jgi:hypothetical protein
LKALKEKDSFNTIRKLAIASGFKGVQDRDFKDAFNHLVELEYLMPYQVGIGEKSQGQTEPLPLTMGWEKKKTRQHFWRMKVCVRCPIAKSEQNLIICPRYGWSMTKELAERQELCVF